MSINRYFQPTPYEGQLYAPPVQFIAAALQSAQKQYDTNYADAEALKNQYIQSLPVDRARANEIQQKTNADIDSIVSKYSGDYSQATKDLQALKSRMAKDFGPGGEAYAIQSNYARMQESLAAERKRLADGKITEGQLSNWYNYTNSNYKGVGQLNPVTGTYNVLQPEDIADYVDHQKNFEETLAKIKPRKVTRPVPLKDCPPGQNCWIDQTTEQIDPNEVYNSFQGNLLNDEKFLNYVKQQARWSGQDPQAYLQDLLGEYKNNIIPSRTGVFGDEKKLHMQADPLYMENVRYQHSRALEGLKQANRIEMHNLKTQADRASEIVDGGDFAVLGQVANTIAPFSPVTEHRISGLPGRPFSTATTTSGLPNVDQLLVKKDRSDINYPLLESIRKANPNMQNSDVWLLYNKNGSLATKDKYNTISYSAFSQTKSQTEEADRLVPNLISGSARIYKYDPTTSSLQKLDSSSGAELATGWYNTETRKAKVKAIGKTSIATGLTPYGTVITAPDGGTYIVEDNSTKFRNLNEDLRQSAFGWIQDPTKTQGATFSLPERTANGTIVNRPVVGVKEYEFDKSTLRAAPVVRYYEPTWNPATNSWTLDKSAVDSKSGLPKALYHENGRPWGPEDVESRLIPTQERLKTYPANPRRGSSDEEVPYED